MCLIIKLHLVTKVNSSYICETHFDDFIYAHKIHTKYSCLSPSPASLLILPITATLVPYKSLSPFYVSLLGDSLNFPGTVGVILDLELSVGTW